MTQLAFPKTNIKATGTAYDVRNESLGEFYGHIKDVRPITSEKDPTVFGVIDIEGADEKGNVLPGPFQFYLHYNPDTTPDRANDPESSKASRSVGFLKNSATDLAIACGKTPVAPQPGQEMAWAEQMFNAFAQSGDKFWFKQSQSSRGLEIRFITKNSAQAPAQNSGTMTLFQ